MAGENYSTITPITGKMDCDHSLMNPYFGECRFIRLFLSVLNPLHTQTGDKQASAYWSPSQTIVFSATAYVNHLFHRETVSGLGASDKRHYVLLAIIPLLIIKDLPVRL